MNRHERGSVVLMTAVLLPVLIFVLGLATDFGIMYAVRNSAQNALQANPFLGSSTATLTPTPGGYSCTDALGFQNYCYKVTVTNNSPTFFARVFGQQSVAITVTALAQTNTGLGMGPSCVRPVFVPDT